MVKGGRRIKRLELKIKYSFVVHVVELRNDSSKRKTGGIFDFQLL